MNKQELLSNIDNTLSGVYDEESQNEIMMKLERLLDTYHPQVFHAVPPMDETRAYLITYGDSIYDASSKEATLQTFKRFVDKNIKGLITDIHILPMFRYTSDDGFSVIDYLEIEPSLGEWKDIDALKEHFHLMYDFVANHLSKSSTWFQHYLQQEIGYEHAFIERDSAFDSTNVVRPRTSPLFHTYTHGNHKKQVWTTFSEDQVDVNFKDPDTFLRLTSVLLEYCKRGATSIRLDAIGFIWKQSATSCMSLPQTHALIRVWRMLIDYVAMHTQIITETNVPHQENISYFGNGENEANQVYQFALPPLVLHSFTSHDATKLNRWASSIQAPSQIATYFNFLSSHDGIGMRPVEELLNGEEIQALVDKTQRNGGKVSFKTNTDGSKSVYELNINYIESLRNAGESDTTLAKKAIAAHNILLSMVGVPAIYYHALFGSRNDIEGMERSGIARRINREKLDIQRLENELKNNSFRHEIFEGICNLLEARKHHIAFYPYGTQEILNVADHVVALCRSHGDETLISYTNVSDEPLCITLDRGYDVFNETFIEGQYTLEPYGILWLKTK